ncbi:MAG TPA: zinc ribbon domain-containing protein, partial [Bacteroidia bacterium]
PTYTYRCATCEHQFETVQRMTDKKLSKCPQCHLKNLERIIVVAPATDFTPSKTPIWKKKK